MDGAYGLTWNHDPCFDVACRFRDVDVDENQHVLIVCIRFLSAFKFLAKKAFIDCRLPDTTGRGKPKKSIVSILPFISSECTGVRLLVGPLMEHVSEFPPDSTRNHTPTHHREHYDVSQPHFYSKTSHRPTDSGWIFQRAP